MHYVTWLAICIYEMILHYINMLIFCSTLCARLTIINCVLYLYFVKLSNQFVLKKTCRATHGINSLLLRKSMPQDI